jgi:tetratricopeptide (TPR) repeat protein
MHLAARVIMSDLEQPTQEVRRWPALNKVAIGSLFAVVAALGIVWGIERWQSWPLREAETSLAAGDPQRAEALASFYLDGQRDDPRGLAVRARALVQLGRGSEAVAIYEQIGGASPDDIHAWAAAYLLTESWSRGKHLLEQYLRMQPGDPEATYELATCTARLGRIKDAIEMAIRFTELSEQKAPGLLLQAIFSQDLGDSDAAAEAYRLVIEAVPDAAGLQLPPHEVFLQFGNTLLDGGDAAAATVQFQRSIAILPTGEAFFRLGRAAAQSGNQEAATNAWKQAVEIQPESVSPREALAESALARGDTAAAEEWLAPLAEVASERAETAYLFQRLAAGQDDSDAFSRWKKVADQARERQQRDRLIEQFVIAAPTNPWAIAVRAHRFAAAGNWQQAGDLLEGLPSSFSGEPFVQNLRTAVQEQGPLPSLDSVPINEP